MILGRILLGTIILGRKLKEKLMQQQHLIIKWQEMLEAFLVLITSTCIVSISLIKYQNLDSQTSTAYIKLHLLGSINRVVFLDTKTYLDLRQKSFLTRVILTSQCSLKIL